jgi:hypothetical protein
MMFHFYWVTYLKKIIPFLLITFITEVMFSQNSYGSFLTSNKHQLADQIIKPSVQTPNVAAFQKQSFIPTSNFTGKADVSIPIFTIKSGGMEVPISLAYNTSGVKVADMASSVGLNWSLNAGGVVSKVTQGLDDFEYPVFLGYDIMMRSPAGWLADLNPNIESRGSENPSNDAMPDKFIASAPGLRTEFLNKKGGTAIDLRASRNIIQPIYDFIKKPYTAPNGNQVMSNIFSLKNLMVTSLNGIKYNFGTPEIINSTTTGLQVSANYLDKMTNLKTGVYIGFDYEPFSNYYHDEKKSYVKAYGGGSQEGFHGENIYTTTSLGYKLRYIHYNEGSVEFKYDINRMDYPGEKALSSIIVKDFHGKVIKEFRLRYSYFQSPTSINSVASKRLRLDEVFQVDSKGNPSPGYKFSYFDDYSMPPRDSYAYDFLGYNNGSFSPTNMNPFPTMYYYDHKVIPFYRNGAITLPGNFSMSANLNYCKAYTLEKITLPSGGIQEFEYELNSFLYAGSKYEGGGLRIKSQYLKSEAGEDQIIDFQYDNGTIGRFPTYAAFRMKGSSFAAPSNLNDLTSQVGFDVFSVPHNQIEFNNGSFVGYGIVRVSNRQNNGYTVYNYNSESNDYSSINFLSNRSVNSAWTNFSGRVLSVNNDFKRGAILSETVYNSNDRIISLKRYEYEEEKFGSVDGLTFYNKVNNDCADYTYLNNDLEVVESCGGYKEILNFPLSRFLLKKTRSTDYGTVGEDPRIQDETNGIFVETKLQYDRFYPLVVSELITNYESDIQEGTTYDPENAFWYSRKKYVYPTSGEGVGVKVNDFPYSEQLYDQNRISLPMQIEISGNRGYSKQTFNYKNFGSGIIDVATVKTELRDDSVLPAMEITRRDTKGNPIEIKKENGRYMTILYGYKNTQVIALIDGITYNDLNSLFYQSSGKHLSHLSLLADLDKTLSSESTLKEWLKKLHYAAENSSNKTIDISTFTHDPLVGITSSRDQRGIENEFLYDSFMRLSAEKNDDGFFTKIIDYNLTN